MPEVKPATYTSDAVSVGLRERLCLNASLFLLTATSSGGGKSHRKSEVYGTYDTASGGVSHQRVWAS